MSPKTTRRSFLAGAASLAVPATLAARGKAPGILVRRAGPIAIASANGKAAVNQAVLDMLSGNTPVDAAVRAVGLVEDDPKDMSVGYGGLPNADGIVELDSCCMDGPSHLAGAVASLRNIQNPAQVALKVLRRTDHVLLVGEGALRFARLPRLRREEPPHRGRPQALARLERAPLRQRRLHRPRRQRTAQAARRRRPAQR
jgi:N4-(beta-N-acetylglucosaminyl)-L-asparaginase